jgi:uncharacterized Zn finger protein (UPF0148 family)
MLGNCHRCGSPLIQIDHYGDRLIGCPACNRWRGDKSAFIVELEVEDWEALGKLRNSLKWTLRHKKSLTKKELIVLSPVRGCVKRTRLRGPSMGEVSAIGVEAKSVFQVQGWMMLVRL